MEDYLEWIIPIFSSLVTIIATVVTCRWQLRTELRKISENYVSDKKYKAYYNAVDLFYTIMSEMKTNEANEQGNYKVTEMKKVKENLFMVLTMPLGRLQIICVLALTKNRRRILLEPFWNLC